jgi:DNA gyrase subunit A
MDLLVVTEAGYGKRTRIDEYRKTSRGAKGVLTIKLTEAKGGLAGALVVRPHQELVFISQNGMIQRTGVKGISQQGRSATGVRVMNPRDGDQVSAVALIVESEDESGETTLDVSGEEIVVGATEPAADGVIAIDDDEESEDEIGPDQIGPDGATAEDGAVEEE